MTKLEEISGLINNGASMSEVARKRGVSRQAIEDFLQRNHFDYPSIFKKRREEKQRIKDELRKVESRRICNFCKKEFSLDDEGALRNYCSKECLRRKENKCRNESNRIYYRTERGRAYIKRYQNTHKEQIKETLKRWYIKKVSLMTKEELEEFKQKNKEKQQRYWKRKALIDGEEKEMLRKRNLKNQVTWRLKKIAEIGKDEVNRRLREKAKAKRLLMSEDEIKEMKRKNSENVRKCMLKKLNIKNNYVEKT